MTKESIKKFWVWFSENSQSFGKNFENIALLSELDRRVTELGNFTWEVGPGKTTVNALVISPNGDFELLPFTKKIIENSKVCLGWEYYYAKPPKIWELVFYFETTNAEQVEIDASGWEYVLLEYEDGIFEILLRAVNIIDLCDDDRQTAVEILLDGVIGEELRITTICSFDVVSEFEDMYKNNANDIKNLLNHINSLL